MTSIHRYDYNPTWSAVAFGAVFFGGLAVLMGLFAKHTNGVISVFLIGVSAAFAGLALFALARRLWRRDVLALADDAIFYPHGFIRRTLTRIPYADIIRVTEAHLHGRSGFCMVTARGTFEIGTNLFRDKESYRAVKESICARASIAIPQSDNPEPASAVRIWTEFPEPVLCWKEPEVWSRFRTSLVAAKPWMLVRRVLGFFVCCFAILVAPWFFVGLDIRPPGCFGVSIAVTLFFTLLRWLSIKYPVHSTDISFYRCGVTQNFGKQMANWNYHDFSGWAVVSRQFQGQTFDILLLQADNRVVAFALSDTVNRNELAQVFAANNIPTSPSLSPPWESSL